MTFKSPKRTLEEKRMSMVLDEDEQNEGTFYPRGCPANIEQMTVREYIYCKRHYWGGWGVKRDMKQSAADFAEAAVILLSNTICLLLWPIVVAIAAKRAITREKKYCEKWRPKEVPRDE